MPGGGCLSGLQSPVGMVRAVAVGANTQAFGGGPSHVGEREAAGFDDFDAAGQGLGRLAQQRGRSAAKQKEARGPVGPVDQDTQDLEQVRRQLDLVDDDQGAQALQRGHWLR